MSGALDPTRPVRTEAVEAICRLRDDRYRNQWITFAYADLSVQLANRTGGNANWFTFGRWSSYTVGENLRLDQPSMAFAQLVSSEPWMRLFSGPLTRLQHSLRLLSDAAMPRALAIGNRLVFHEIAFAIASFLDWLDENPPVGGHGDDAAFDAFLAQIKTVEPSDMYCAGDISWLHEGIRCYYAAACEPDPKRQAEYVLRANLRLAQYEQWRLQPVIQIALDPVAKHLVEFRNADPHDPAEPVVVLKHRGTPWAFRQRSPMWRWLTEHYETFMTRHVFAWEGPIRGRVAPLFLGRGLDDRPGGQPLYPALLERLDDEHTRTLVEEFDRSGGNRAGRGAHNWTRFAERMNFVVSLFRAEQRDQGMFEVPSPRDRRIIDLALEDAHLDHLRTIGDPAADRAVAAFCHDEERNARDVVSEMISDGLYDYDGLRADDALPVWVSAARLIGGKTFLCDFGLEIASALFCGSLPYSYTAADGARVLTCTAELTTGHTTRRVAETGQMLIDLMADNPSPLQPGTRGAQSVRGVRLFHAAVRHMILHDNESPWSVERYGVPINQEDLVGTLVVFTVVVLDALDNLGIVTNSPANAQARDDYVHFWLAVGHLLGIDYSLLRRSPSAPEEQPLTIEELRLVGETIFRRHARESADGQTLMASLLDVMQRQMRLPMTKNYPAALTRQLIGNTNADMLGVPPAGPVGMLIDLARPFLRAVAPHLQGRSLSKLASIVTKRMYQEWIDAERGNRPPWRVDYLQQKKWGLRPPRHESPDLEAVARAEQETRTAPSRPEANRLDHIVDDGARGPGREK